jgi:rhodanese-related sulfurtransferase
MNGAGHPEWIITAAELMEATARGALKSGAIALLDVRQPEEHAQSRIEPCRLVPLNELMARIEGEMPDKDQDIVIYCAHGVRSLHALMGMAQLGYTKMRSLEGGICAWDKAISKSVDVSSAAKPGGEPFA